MKRSQVEKIKKAMRSELDRSIHRLRAPGHPKPYFISYLLRDIESLDVWASYGSLSGNKFDHKRNCFADVRVGSYRYDQTMKGGLDSNSDEAESYELIDMPIEDGSDALRFALWRLTDARYRESVKEFHERKSRDVSYLDENKKLNSFSKQKADTSQERLKALSVNRPEIEKYVKKASSLFKKYSFIKNSYVDLTAELQTKVFVSSEGVERVFQNIIYRVYVYMWLHTKKCNLDTSISYSAKDIDDLPSLRKLSSEIKSKVDTLIKIEKGDRITSYTGPVLLAPRPAGLLLHEAVGHRLEGSRLLSNDEGRTFKDKIGEKIMHKDLSIYDDPTMKKIGSEWLIGDFPYDDEGTKSQRVVLVEKGKLKGFLSTRSPLPYHGYSNNGHARNQNHERPVSRIGNFIVESSSKHSFDDLKKLLIEEVKKRKLPYGVILLEVEGGETGTEAYNFQAFLGEITSAVKVFPDGKEVYIKGVDFVGTPLSALSNIIAVGKDLEVDNAYCGAESGSVPVSTVSCALLLSNLELQAKESNKVTQYALPLPWFDK